MVYGDTLYSISAGYWGNSTNNEFMATRVVKAILEPVDASIENGVGHEKALGVSNAVLVHLIEDAATQQLLLVGFSSHDWKNKGNISTRSH
jgi:hypothetical protein